MLCGVVSVSPAHSAEAHGGESSGVNIFNLQEWPLGVWTIVVFIVLLYLLRKYAWGPMLEGLQRREANIHEAIASAQRARVEAEKLREQFEAQVNQAQERQREILDEGRRLAQQLRDEMVAKAREEIQTERDRTRREISMARDQALQELWNQTAHLATLVSAKVIRRQLNGDDHRRLVDEAIADLRNAGSQRQREVASVQR
jgi:F-type H+-transporting ATPase subunit b